MRKSRSKPRHAGGRALAGVLAVAYFLVFSGLPAVTAWRLMAHLTTDHHVVAVRPAHDPPLAEPAHHPRRSHAAEHAAGARHQHDAEPRHVSHGEEHAPEAAEPPVAASAPHEHAGTIHTHEMGDTTQSHLLNLVLAKHYPHSSALPPIAALASPARRAYGAAGVPQTVLSVETPPPRRAL